jgi:hypothetical protein
LLLAELPKSLSRACAVDIFVGTKAANSCNICIFVSFMLIQYESCQKVPELFEEKEDPETLLFEMQNMCKIHIDNHQYHGFSVNVP